MTKKIFRTVLLSSMSIFLGTIILILGYLYHYFTNSQLDQLRLQTSLIAQAVEEDGQSYLDHIDLNDLRVTWIDQDGQVLYDSEKDVSQLDNHGNREEVVEALKTGYGESIRQTATLTQRLLYTSQRLQDGTVVRLAIAQKTIVVLLWKLAPWVGTLFIISILVAISLARLTSQKLLAPLEAIDLDNPLENEVYSELHPLLKRLDLHQSQLEEKERLFQQKQDEFDTIISKIKEGLIIVDAKGHLISCNGAASQLFGFQSVDVGEFLPSFQRNLGLRSLMETVLSGQKVESVCEIKECQYKVIARPIWTDGLQSGAVLLFFDVTEQYHLDKLRREFTSTVSHELRTPLHILSGYSEILRANVVSPENVQSFSEKIYQESQRMIQLVEGILQLTQLDEGRTISKESIHFKELIQQVISSLQEKADQREIAIQFEGENVAYKGNLALIQSIVYNLCDNAIKYNKYGGRVIIRLYEVSNQIIFEVKDTGIGISPDDQERIFERFYRVDKSRSKQVGGTGLGLSIVKHALHVHGASIQVTSQLGQGTTMLVRFPKENH